MTITVDMGDAKARLSELVSRAEAGEEIVITRDGCPVALLSRLPRADEIRAAIEEILGRSRRDAGDRRWGDPAMARRGTPVLMESLARLAKGRALATLDRGLPTCDRLDPW